MTNILHLIDTSGPGGAETVFVNLVSAFDGDGFRSVSLVAPGSWVGDWLEPRGHHVETCRTRGSFNLSYFQAMERLVRSEGIDLIQAHLPGPCIYAGIYSLISGVPLVSTLHGGVDFANAGRFKGIKLGALDRGSDRIVAVSEHLRHELETGVGLSPDKLHVIHNGVDVETFSERDPTPIRDELGLPADAFVVVSIGNIRPAKGYDVLVEASAHLKGVDPEIHFVVAGQPRKDLFDDILSLRERLDVVSRVHFLGFRSDPEGLLASADLFLLPSTSEGFSISTIEAMAAGLGVVATRSGGPQEIVTDGLDGRLVPIRDPAAMAEAIREMAVDPSLRATLGERARATVGERFSLEAMARHYRELYESVLEG